MLRPLLSSLTFVAALAGPVAAQQRSIDVEVTHTYDGPATVCVPLSVPEKYAGQREVIVENPTGGVKSQLLAQLTTPGLLTDHIPPSAPGLVRRDLHCQFVGLKVNAGDVTRLKVQLDAKNMFVGYGFDWTLREAQYADLALNYGKMAVLRYLHAAYDNSSNEKRELTSKVFHQVYELRASKGGMIETPRHDLVYAFNKITFDATKECDLWNATPGDAHQGHAESVVKEAARIVGRHRVLIHWCGPKQEVFAKEEREYTAYNLGPRGTLVEFASRLKTTGGLVKLRGDPGFAGLQFRANKDVQEKKMQMKTYFLRPDGKGKYGETRNWDPKTAKGPVNLPWNACSFIADGKRATAVYVNHPNNPGESRWNESDSGQFGCYFEYDLTEKKPLVVQYRVYIKPGVSSPGKGEFEITQAEVDKLCAEFREPPKVKVLEPGK